MLIQKPNPDLGYYMMTHSGRMFYPGNPRESDIDVEDIVHGLSNIARFAGQTCSFYSVAEHCVRGSRTVPDNNPSLAFEFLFHDGGEAYMGDQIRPVNRLVGTNMFLLQRKVQAAVFTRFGMSPIMSDECEEIDNRMLVTEAKAMFPAKAYPWWEEEGFPDPFPGMFAPGKKKFWNPEKAQRKFVQQYLHLLSKLPVSELELSNG